VVAWQNKLYCFSFWQTNSDKSAKHLESQISELTAKLDQSQREIQELHSAKSRAQAETADLSQKLEEADSQVNQLNKVKQTLTRSLEEVKASLEDESRVRTKLQGENRNLQSELEQLREQVCDIGPRYDIGCRGNTVNATAVIPRYYRPRWRQF